MVSCVFLFLSLRVSGMQDAEGRQIISIYLLHLKAATHHASEDAAWEIWQHRADDFFACLA